MAQFSMSMLLGRISPWIMVKAVRDYSAMKPGTMRMLNYDAADMERYFFVSRKVATTPQDIGRLGFFRCYIQGITRFF